MIRVNGVVTDNLPVTDRGLLYGDGVWETIGIQQGKPQLLEWHLERLQTGLAALGIQSLDWDTLREEIRAACAGEERAILKLIVTRGVGQRGYSPHTLLPPTRILQVTSWPEYPAAYTATGIRLTLCETRLAQQPRLAGFKHLNRLEQVLARAEFGSEVQEGLVRDYHGNIIEGTMSNLFIIRADGAVVTPELSQCGIAGIMRRYIAQTLEKFSIECHIQPLALVDVEQAQAIFMTNSLIGVWPVCEFSDKSYNIPSLIRDLQAEILVLP
ncbi:aminodeoxychorismate lyase [Thiothrix lacustris]|uniref:aminodeoxychorismate lyase n=1 Tax=Thiothrix lacustris TaxID=525917 RepID=UPI0027E465A0|nr:aminodeoxychorismate lyase [Thiothrix lacustris]WMP17508.1 aminodeoxychorismate lyase [Thiothrix lacustris]